MSPCGREKASELRLSREAYPKHFAIFPNGMALTAFPAAIRGSWGHAFGSASWFYVTASWLTAVQRGIAGTLGCQSRHSRGQASSFQLARQLCGSPAAPGAADPPCGSTATRGACVYRD